MSTDPTKNIVAGASYGGQAAVFTGLRRLDLFGNVLSLSGSFNFTPDATIVDSWMIRQFVQSPRLPLCFYMDVGLLQSVAQGYRAGLLETNWHMRDVLRAKGYIVLYAEFSGGHDYVCWRGTLPNGLMALVGRGPRVGGAGRV